MSSASTSTISTTFFDSKIEYRLTEATNYDLCSDEILQAAKEDYDESLQGTRNIRSLAFVTLCFSKVIYLFLALPLWSLRLFSALENLCWEGKHNFFKRHSTRLSEVPTTLALKLVYLPHTKVKCRGGWRSYVFWQRKRIFCMRSRAIIKGGEDMIREIEQEKEDIKSLDCSGRQQAIEERRREHQAAAAIRARGNNTGLRDVLKDSYILNEQIESLTALYKSLETDIRNIRSIIETQAALEFGNCEGLSAWAKGVKAQYDSLLQATIAISFVGASITYSTIFSAVRGNIGLMSWAFALFNIGIVLPVLTQTLLLWCAHIPRNVPLLSALHWRAVLTLITYTSLIAVVTAIYLLSICIFKLTYQPDETGNMRDPGLEFNIVPRPSSVMALAFAALAVIVVLGFMVFSVMGQGYSALKTTIISDKGPHDPVKLQDYVIA